MHTPAPALKTNWLMMHVIRMYARLLIGSLLSILFLSINNRKAQVLQKWYGSKNLKKDLLIASASVQGVERKDSQAFFQSKDTNFRSITETGLNFLNSIDNLSYQLIGLGFPLLT